MQLQLSLNIADRLYHQLLVRGESLGAEDAASLLLGTRVSHPLSRDLLACLVRDDARFCWEGAGTDALALRIWGADDPDLWAVPFVALDLETTGSQAGANKITEIGAVRIEGLRVVDHFETLVNPQRAIPPIITDITGITQSMVADAPRIEDVVPSLLAFLQGAVVVAHNAAFDVGFLNYELDRLGGLRLGDGAIDTLPLSRSLVPGLTNYKLGTVAEALGAPGATRHRALADAQAVAHVFVSLADVLAGRGVTKLSGVRRHGPPSPASQTQKLRLTRDMPNAPGTFVFRDETDSVLLVGKADSLQDHVRSLFISAPPRQRDVRTAVRLVERISWQEALSPLEAAVHEQALLLEHRPTHGPYRTAPERYAYIKAGGAGPGLTLSATTRAPRGLFDQSHATTTDTQCLAIGPFRRRFAAQAAVELLRRCYKVRHCPRRAENRPCERATSGLCLSPCTGDASSRVAHDRLVIDILAWLAGLRPDSGLDPLRRAEEVAVELSRTGLREEARLLREACEHLVTTRKSYEAIARARSLYFAYLGRLPSESGPRTVRLNVVCRGMLEACVSLSSDTVERQLDETMAAVTGGLLRRSRDGEFVAVPQKHLDSLLAVGRWHQEESRTSGILVPLQGTTAEAIEASRLRLAAEARSLLEQ